MKTEPNDLCHPIFEKEESYDYKGNHNGFTTSLCGGLTKREHFASLVLPEMANIYPDWKDAARNAVQLADALIEELNK